MFYKILDNLKTRISEIFVMVPEISHPAKEPPPIQEPPCLYCDRTRDKVLYSNEKKALKSAKKIERTHDGIKANCFFCDDCKKYYIVRTKN